MSKVSVQRYENVDCPVLLLLHLSSACGVAIVVIIMIISSHFSTQHREGELVSTCLHALSILGSAF